MRKEKAVVTLLNNLAKILSEEAARNPEFADKLDALLEPISPARSVKPRLEPSGVPDAYAEYKIRGEPEFSHWLRDQPKEVLHALIRRHDLDATRKTAKWKNPEKLIAFITDQIRSRLNRGAGFLSTGDEVGQRDY